MLGSLTHLTMQYKTESNQIRDTVSVTEISSSPYWK